MKIFLTRLEIDMAVLQANVANKPKIIDERVPMVLG
jgi:hypothetical protein